MPAGDQPTGKRELLISKTWFQVAALVFVFGFFVLGLLAYRTYKSDPPIPDRVVDPSGRVVFSGDDIRAVLGGALLVNTIVGLYLWADLRSAPSGFPWVEGERSGPAPTGAPRSAAR
jgi:hypothetical protein